MGVKVDFDPDTREIQITEAPVVPAGGTIAQQTINVEIDLYSDGKEDWESGTPAGIRKNKFPFVTAESAGAALPGGRVEPAFYRLLNGPLDGWRILPFDVDHELTIIGTLVPDDETKPIYKARAGRTILIFIDGTQVAGLDNQGVRDAMQLEASDGKVNIDTQLSNVVSITSGNLSR